MFYAASKLLFLLLRPSNAVIVAMLLGLLLRKTRRLRQLGRILLGGGFLLLVVASWTGLSVLLIRPLELRFPVPDASTKAPTGIIILGGVIDSALSTVANPELTDGAERIMTGAALARRYPEARIIYTGGSAELLTVEVPEADVAGPLLVGMGVAPERLTLENKSRNTRENATMTYDIIQPKPDDTWLLVTSAHHMPRAMGVFRAAGWTGITAYPVDFRTDGPAGLISDHSASASLFLTDLAVKEWLGLLAYRFAGYTDALYPEP